MGDYGQRETGKKLSHRKMKQRTTHEISELHVLFRYDPATGHIHRLKDSGKMKAGQRAERKTRNYLCIKIPCKYEIFSHRVAWAMTYGKWPDGDVDHINGDATDNRISNLRDVSHMVNLQNRRFASKNSKTGFLGVSKSGAIKNKYRADIHINGRQLLIGHFDTPDVAYEAYLKKKRELHDGCTI